MGFRTKKKEIVVRFAEDHDLYGLEATFTGMDIRTYLRITGMDGGKGEDQSEAMNRCANALTSWNLEDDDGKPVPATVDTFMEQDHKLVIALAGAWLEGLAGVPKSDPLADGSGSGEKSPEAQIGMEIPQ